MQPGPSTHRRFLGLVLGLALVAAPICGRAEGSFGGHVAATSDYVFRGVSQTRGAAAVQADLHYQTTAGWFGGLWASTVDLNRGPGATLELNAYLGRAWPISTGWNARVAAVEYVYPNDTSLLRYDYFELVTSVSYQDRLVATVAWSPDTSRYSSYGIGRHRSTLTYELLGRVPVWGPLEATASLGYYDLSELFGAGYLYGGAGVGCDLDRFRLDLAYFLTDHQAADLFGYEVAAHRWSLTAAWRFR